MKTMRIAVSMLFLTLAVFACDQGPPTAADLAGMYELESVNGESVDLQEWLDGVLELRADSTFEFVLTYIITDTFPGTFTLGETVDGCIEISLPLGDQPVRLGSGNICGPVLTVVENETTQVFRKTH